MSKTPYQFNYIKPRLAPLVLLAVLPICGCNMTQSIQGSSNAIDANRIAIEKSTQAIQTNAEVIAASTGSINQNRSAIESTSGAIETNAEVIAASTAGINQNRNAIESTSAAIQTNYLVITRSTLAVEQSSLAVSNIVAATLMSNQAINANRAIIDQSTAAVAKNVQTLNEVNGLLAGIQDHKAIWLVCIVLVITLLFAPSVLTLIALCQIKRLASGDGRSGRTIGSGKEPPHA
jgi:hypothetical protein